MDRLTNQQIADARLGDWRKLAQGLHARFRSPDPSALSDFIGGLLALERSPDVRLTPGVVDVSVFTREDGIWVTPADLETARIISELARRAGLTADPAGVTQLELALDTARENVVGPFWAALLTGDVGNKIHDTVFDPTGRVPSVWFQKPDTNELDGDTSDGDTSDGDTSDAGIGRTIQRWHFDLWLAPEIADERIAAAVAAGGTIVFDGEAPAFTVLADQDGNRVCICTSLERG